MVLLLFKTEARLKSLVVEFKGNSVVVLELKIDSFDVEIVEFKGTALEVRFQTSVELETDFSYPKELIFAAFIAKS